MICQLTCAGFLSALLLVGACNTSSDVKPPEQQIEKTLAQQPSPQIFPAGLLDDDPKAKEAWEKFTSNGRYRIARRDDFQIPEKVMREHLDDPFVTNKFAYVGGDFNRDGHLLDLAFIVVDTTTTAKERFGLVIFNAPTDRNDLPSAHWVRTSFDLSKSVLSAATDVLSLNEYHEDGSEELCNVRWDKRRGQYSCEVVR
ncbi:MAG TPA: hypothetical protein VE135_20385 [Pyrinomonadaceae bacterium]|nr:hypothetical protein [Pyrinomonadaceae bacterium]